MKNLKFIILCFLFFACSADSEPTDENKKQNKAPEVPVLLNPEDNLFCIDNELDFSWISATDPEGENVSYVFEISTSSDFSEIYYRKELSSLTVNKQVDKGMNYYWRVVAKDSKGNTSAYSAVRNFYTEEAPSTNSLPSVPKKLSPKEYKIYGSVVELAWESIDLDNDELKYDLYFGTSENPPLLEENLLTNAFEINNLAAGTIYHWMIVTIDGKGGKSIGQVWSFKTN
ncbi:hypothetical protein OQ279_15920 [Salinimicrobium sp. MT39]|uniref:Fibronectin type-III domain-containing protein n=1 Tax=Salinimicrobium profundisediminis TaxID=2994553 RepID=A0A9X3CZN1_9FLAO|nr:hypothetical protein [Salinimicrobium profundisediminis]MCX2839635.1 hypothetical protein [Salinimicrobium profundisediminis]